MTVYYVTTTVMVFCTLLIAFALPESFGAEQQEMLRRDKLEKERERHAKNGSPKTRMGRTIDACLAPARLVRHLLPEPRPEGKGKNYRLFIIAISLLIASFVSGYNMTNVIVYANTNFGFDAEKVRYRSMYMAPPLTCDIEWLHDDHSIHYLTCLASSHRATTLEIFGTILQASVEVSYIKGGESRPGEPRPCFGETD